MAIYPLRKLPSQSAFPVIDAWIEQLEHELTTPQANRAEICRRALCALTFPAYAESWETAVHDESLPLSTRAALMSLDPRNITLEPEYYAECDDEKFQRVKPLLWLWYSYDRTIMGGQNVEAGVRLRRMLAKYIFKRCGDRFKAFQNVEFSFGYNMEVGDDVVVHRNVLLDDRGGIVLGNKVSISDFANIYSHTHSIVDQRDVTDAQTQLEDGVRVTYHATILAGVHVGCDAMVGAMAVATRDVRAHHVYVGIPAKSVRVKPTAPAQNDCLPTARERRNPQ
jgi:acetyltransferase-like isoleucine patch superfamily enzyme